MIEAQFFFGKQIHKSIELNISFAGISFAIPIDYAKEFLRKSEEARRNRRKFDSPPRGGATSGERRYIGITMLTITANIIDELRQRLEMHPSVTHGIVVFRIVRGSPAEKAGLMPGTYARNSVSTSI